MTDNISMESKGIIKDAHIHLSFLSEQKLKTYFHQAKKMNVHGFALGGYDQKDWLKQIEIKKINPNIRTCFGLHPWAIEEKNETELKSEWNFLLSIALRADAIGETGVDRFRLQDKKVIEKQMHYFSRSLELASQLKKPLVLHVVQAHDMILKAIDESDQSYGIVHSFSGSYEIAKEYVKRGYLISVGPRILGEGFKHLKETVERMNLETLLLESDDSIDPHDLYKVAEKVAEIKSCAMDRVLCETAANFDKVFK